MIPHKKNTSQIGFFSSYNDLLNMHHPLFILGNNINWQIFEDNFLPLYCADNGRPAKPIRLMVGLLMLKHIRNISGGKCSRAMGREQLLSILLWRNKFCTRCAL